jgi:hypothetical protein
LFIIVFAAMTLMFAVSMSVTAQETSVNSAEEKAIESAVDKTIDKAAEKAVEKAAEEITDEKIEKAIEKATEKVTEEKIEKAIEKAVEKASNKTLEHEERPDKWMGPTKINYMTYLIDVDNIDGAKQSFAANFYVMISWKDRRLAEDTEYSRQLPLEKVWNPRVLVVNQGGNLWESLPKIVEVTPDGTVIYRQRYVGPLSQPLMLSDFPMDEHLFRIHFVAAGYLEKDLEFVPSVIIGMETITGGGIADQLSLSDWEITKFEAVPLAYEAIKGRPTAGFAIEFTAKRAFPFYFWQVTVPLLLIVMMSCTVFWIDPANASSRIGVATSSILTLIAYRFVLAGMLPRLPYMTRMDYFTFGSTLLIFMTLVEVILSSALTSHNYGSTANTIDKLSKVTFPILFLLMFAWFMSGVWNN